MSNIKYAVLALLIFAGMYGCSQEPQDLSIPMKAGEYQVTLSKLTSGVEDPTKRSKVRCYREAAFDPFKIYHQNKDCKITNVVKSETEASFDFDCNKGAAADAKGKMKYSAIGDKITWSSAISSIDGNEMDITTSGTGDYLGKCK
jgi:Protein of unknown function (DUF3617)